MVPKLKTEIQKPFNYCWLLMMDAILYLIKNMTIWTTELRLADVKITFNSVVRRESLLYGAHQLCNFIGVCAFLINFFADANPEFFYCSTNKACFYLNFLQEDWKSLWRISQYCIQLNSNNRAKVFWFRTYVLSTTT